MLKNNCMACSGMAGYETHTCGKDQKMYTQNEVNNLLSLQHQKDCEEFERIIGEDEEHNYAWNNPKMPEIARNTLRSEQRLALKKG